MHCRQIIIITILKPMGNLLFRLNCGWDSKFIQFDYSILIILKKVKIAGKVFYYKKGHYCFHYLV